MNATRGALGVLATLVFVAAPQESAAQTLPDAIAKMARDIQAYLDDNSIQDVVVDNFSGPPDSSAGRLVSNELKKKLKELGIAVGKRAASRRKLTGSFFYEPNPGEDLGVVLIEAELLDRRGKPETSFRNKVETQTIGEAGDVTRLLGITTDLTDATDNAITNAQPQGTGAVAARQVSATRKQVKQLRDQQIANSQDNPTFAAVDSSTVAAKAGSAFRMELLVFRDGAYQPLEITDSFGFAFAPLRESDKYAVRIHNTAAHAVSVELMIDGVNTLDLSTVPNYRKLGRWVIPAGGRGVIKGWHKTDQIQHAFLVTSQEDSVAKELGAPTAGIGTITASFYHAWSDAEPTPEVERVLGTGDGSLGVGTGEGPPVEGRSTQVFMNHGKQLLASVNIRYDNPEPTDLPEEDELPTIN